LNDISVIGAGAFGTALGISLAKSGRRVRLIARNADQARQLQADRENVARLPGFRFPDGMSVHGHVGDADPDCLLAIPTQKLSGFLSENSAALAGKPLVACSKGVDLATGQGPTALFKTLVPDCQVAVLSGPSFAVDIAAGLPTALTLAATPSDLGERLQTLLSASNLRVYRTTDIAGVEMGGALKNVIAIASGVAIGAKLGESARAALVTRGYAEMTRFALAYGAQPETLAGLSGFGDLILTATSEKSRNYAYGLALGSGKLPDRTQTVEGSATAHAIMDLAKGYGIDMPITATVSALVHQEITVQKAIEALMARPLKEE